MCADSTTRNTYLIVCGSSYLFTDHSKQSPFISSVLVRHAMNALFATATSGLVSFIIYLWFRSLCFLANNHPHACSLTTEYNDGILRQCITPLVPFDFGSDTRMSAGSVRPAVTHHTRKAREPCCLQKHTRRMCGSNFLIKLVFFLVQTASGKIVLV